MTSYVTPKKGFPFICYVGLVSRSTGQFQSNPTLAAGDFKISKDGGALGNLATLPAVTPASSKSVKISLDSDETNADNLIIIGSDAAGAEWDDVFLNIQTTVQQIDDLATPTNITAGTITTVSGNVNGSVGSVTGLTASNLDATVSSRLASASYTAPDNATITSIQSDTNDIQSRLPAALSGDGFIKADLKSIDDELTNGNNATLYLKQLDIHNVTDSAVIIHSEGGYGIDVQAFGAGGNSAVRIAGNDASGWDGVDIYGANAIWMRGIGAAGVHIETSGTNLNGIEFVGTGTGKSIYAPNDIAVSDGDLTLANIRNGLALDSDVFDVLSYVSHLTFDSDDKVYANSAVSLTSDDIQAIVDALSFPTADENATTLLKYDLSTIIGEADRSPINALRKLRNKVSFAGSTLSIKKEDDVTNAYTQPVTQDSDQEPFKSVG